MKAPPRTTTLVVLLATLLAAFVVISSPKDELATTDAASPIPDPVMVKNKTQILHIVSSKTPLTPEQRDILFLSLSGPRMLQYHFTEAEKSLIVKTLNSHTQPDQKSSSAHGSFSLGIGAILCAPRLS